MRISDWCSDVCSSALMRLLLDIDGRLARWPEAWPALPPPIGAADAPLPFALRYLGRANFHDAASLPLRHEGTRLDARFRLPEVTAWMSSIANGSPLPPLSGHLSTTPLDISGAQPELGRGQCRERGGTFR